MKYVLLASILLLLGCSRWRKVHKEEWKSAFFLDTTTIIALRIDYDDDHPSGGLAYPRQFNIDQKLFRYSIPDSNLQLVANLQTDINSELVSRAAFCHPWLLYETAKGSKNAGLFNIETGQNETYEIPESTIWAVSKGGRFLITISHVYDRLQKKVILSADRSRREEVIWAEEGSMLALLTVRPENEGRELLTVHDMITGLRDTLFSSGGAIEFSNVNNQCNDILGHFHGKSFLADIEQIIEDRTVRPIPLERGIPQDAQIILNGNSFLSIGQGVRIFSIDDFSSILLLQSTERER